MRLDRALGRLGLSRTEAKQAIRAGRVTVAGARARDAGADCGGAEVLLDGIAIPQSEHAHLMVNKPAGVLTATEDFRCKTVLDLVPERLFRKNLGPVGRLDKDATGLVILTTDGQLAHRLISPKRDAAKIYVARTEGKLDEACVRAFESGVALKDFTAKPAVLRILSASEDESTVEITLTEGKYHQIKRMCGALGHPVLALKRISLGGVTLDAALNEGEARALTDAEIACLYATAGMEAT